MTYWCTCCEKRHKPKGPSCGCHCRATYRDGSAVRPDANALKIREKYPDD